MEFFLLVLVACGGGVWLIHRSLRDRTAIDLLQGRVDLLDERVLSLRRELATRAPESPTSEPATTRDSAISPAARDAGPPALVPSSPLPPAIERGDFQEGVDDQSTVTPPVFVTTRSPSPTELSPPAPVPVRPVSSDPGFNWEQFVGVRLFAWLGGLALFFAAALGLRYSFEHNLVPPEVRAAGGFILGLGLLCGGVVLRRREYVVTAQSLCATGVLILYAVTFACRSFYHFEIFGPVLTFLVMILVTVTAFLLAVRMAAQVVAVLGMLGGFLTPVLLSTGEDNPLGLFGYLALLDLGLIAVVRRKRWDYLLLLAMVGTVVMEFGWLARFFTAEKIVTAQGIFLGMPLLFAGAFAWAVRGNWLNPWVTVSAATPPLMTLAASFLMLFAGDLGSRPGALFTVVFGADLLLLALVTLRPPLRMLESAGGGLAFLLLSVWTMGRLSEALLYWAFGLYFMFALLHTVFPVVLQRLRPSDTPEAPVWSQFFPPLALLLFLLPIVRELSVPGVFWTVVLAVDALAVMLAAVAGAMIGLVAVLVLTLVVAGFWIAGATVQDVQLSEGLVVVGATALFFFGAGAWLWRRTGGPSTRVIGLTAGHSQQDSRLMIPSLSASLPFLLLIMVAAKFRPADPSAIFGLSALLLLLLLVLVRVARLDSLLPVGLGSVAVLQLVWQSGSLDASRALIPLVWQVGFYLVFLLFPFLWQREFQDRRWPWVVSALAGPVQFGLIHLLMRTAYPAAVMGLVPVTFAVPSLLALLRLVRTVPTEAPHRLEQLAWFGGVALFFITVTVPIQFDRQWITLAWVLEGAALCWLFRRLPHPGLPLVGTVLMGIAFMRLSLNPAVLSYHARSGTPVLNWYLYTYGVAAGSLFGGARWLEPTGFRLMGSDVSPVLRALGTVLLFLLVNIEIADFFSPGGTLTFEFSGSFARDMTYTIAWALFALGLVVIGIGRRAAVVRYAGLGLLCVALLKLFLHDLARLNQLYRIGAFAAVAVIAIVASFLYQRFLAVEAKPHPPAGIH